MSKYSDFSFDDLYDMFVELSRRFQEACAKEEEEEKDKPASGIYDLQNPQDPVVEVGGETFFRDRYGELLFVGDVVEIQRLGKPANIVPHRYFVMKGRDGVYIDGLQYSTANKSVNEGVVEFTYNGRKSYYLITKVKSFKNLKSGECYNDLEYRT